MRFMYHMDPIKDIHPHLLESEMSVHEYQSSERTQNRSRHENKINLNLSHPTDHRIKTGVDSVNGGLLYIK